MKKVIVISEECHGTIGVASSFEKAKLFLLESGWLGKGYDVYDTKEGGWCPVTEMFGENWQEEILKQDEDFFDGSFYFREMDFMD